MARHRDSRPTAARIASDIRAMIMSGEWEPGAQIPTTSELMAAHSTSNVTIQRALKVLKEEGLLVGRSGSGVYVRDTPPQVITPATYIAPSSTEEPLRWGISASQRSSTRIVSVAVVTPPKRVARELGEEQAVRRVRLGLLDGEPAEVTRSYYPASWARETSLAKRRRITGGSPAVLQGLGRTPARQTDEVSARAATSEENGLLLLPGDVPVLEVFRVVHSKAGDAVEVTEMVKPGHLYKMGYQVP